MKKMIKNNNNIENIAVVLNEENDIEEIQDNQNIENNEEELNEEDLNEEDLNEEDLNEEESSEDDNENRDIELINYYLHRQNNRNICYRSINELCCSRRTGSYLLIFLLLSYVYSSMY